MSRNDATHEPRYAGFISYSHVDRDVARWLHRSIENYRIPPKIRSQVAGDHLPERLAPIFLDREELASSADLAESVRNALQQSDFLLVVCSPASARSRWVNEEVRSFKEMGRADRILCLIVGGEPRAADKGLPAEMECLPPALLYEIEVGRISDRPAAEPLAADVREGGDTRADARLKIASAMLGVRLDELRQRDQARRQKRLAAIGVASTAGCVVLAALTIVAWLARNEAEEQRRLAEQKSLTAQKTSEFVVSLFKVADPGEARGNTITAREILDRGVRQIDESLRDEPQVRAALTTTLGEVYTGLGLYGPAFDLLSKAREIPNQDEAAALAQTVSLAELEFQRGNDERAEKLLLEADRKSHALGRAADPAMRARLLLARGEVAAVLEQDTAAQKYFREALQIGEAYGLPDVTPRALEGLGLSAYYAGDLPAAQTWYDQALAARIARSGESHPRTSETLNALGSIAYMRGDSTRAEEYWRRSLEVDRRVLGDGHPNLAPTMNNLGRLDLERRNFRGAIEILDQAEAIMAAQRSEGPDSLVFRVSNRALAQMGLGHFADARPLFERALRSATESGHRLEGPIMTDLADLECRVGELDSGLKRLENARPIVAERYPDDRWRLALVDNVRADCLARAGKGTDAERLIADTTSTVLAKWPADTYYGHEALQRATRVYRATGNATKLAEVAQFASQP